jgi:hypothetical protein
MQHLRDTRTQLLAMINLGYRSRLLSVAAPYSVNSEMLIQALITVGAVQCYSRLLDAHGRLQLVVTLKYIRTSPAV